MLQLITSALVFVQASLCMIPDSEKDEMREYADVKTVKEAIEVCKARLVKDGKAQFADLLSEESVCDAIRTAIKGYDTRIEQNMVGSGEYFTQVVKPMLSNAADTKAWPKGCSFMMFYELRGSDSILYNGLWIRLKVDTPDLQNKGFALPILDVSYGRFGF